MLTAPANGSLLDISELAKAVEPHIKQEDEGKFRCKTCSKLFKATSFVEKHVVNKHGELVKQLDDVRITLVDKTSLMEFKFN